MDSKLLIKKIREDVQLVAENGQSVIGVKALDEYLESIEPNEYSLEEQDRKHKEQLESFKQEHERNITKYKTDTEANLEMLRTVINTALVTVKTSLLVNGASAVAILGFLSRVWNAEIPASVSTQLAESLLIFGVGVLISALASAGSYMTQLYFSDEQDLSGAISRGITIVLVFTSFMAFGLGLWHSFSAFSQNL
jgi:hypothetical protein